jgi:hypothetical protein
MRRSVPALAPSAGTNRQFAFAANGPREDQVSDVGTGNDEDERRRREQNQQHSPGARRDLVVKQLGFDLEFCFRRIFFGMFFDHGSVDRFEFGTRLVETHSRGEAAEKFGHTMDASGHHGGGEVMGAGHDVADDLSFCRMWHGGFEDPDDGGSARAQGAVEPDALANDGRVTFECGGPETIREHHCASGAGAIVPHVEQAAKYRPQAHHFKIRPADNTATYLARFTEADHGKAHGRKFAERVQGFDARTQILNFGHGER